MSALVVYVDDASYGSEGRQFAAWLSRCGWEVTSRERCDAPDKHPLDADLWEAYCDDHPTLPPGPDDAAADAYLESVARDGEWATRLAYLAERVIVS